MGESGRSAEEDVQTYADGLELSGMNSEGELIVKEAKEAVALLQGSR
jgi:hypothetical protein